MPVFSFFFFKNINIKARYGAMAATVTPIVIVASIYVAWAYAARALKKKPKARGALSRSMSLAALHGGKLALERLIDYHQVLTDANSMEAALIELKSILEKEQPDFKKLQRTAAKLEMCGKEADAVEILKKAVEEAQNQGKQHEAYEIQMVLVEMLIYKGDFQKALDCKCLHEEQISDARRELYKAIIHIMLEQPKEYAVSCWDRFNEIRLHLYDWPAGLEHSQLPESVQNFDGFEQIVRSLKPVIRKKPKIY